MIEMRKLKDLIQLMEENDLSELVIRDKDEEVALKRGGPVQAAVPAPVAAPAAPAGGSPDASQPEAEADDGLLEITSPMVGTFYAAPSPDAEPFVQVGASVGSDSVVCVIEAMKVFNEIKAEVAGAIEKILVSNGQVVEFGQPLYMVRPAGAA